MRREQEMRHGEARRGIHLYRHLSQELDVKPKDIDKAVRQAATEVS
jgi:hypothetical protein